MSDVIIITQQAAPIVKVTSSGSVGPKGDPGTNGTNGGNANSLILNQPGGDVRIGGDIVEIGADTLTLVTGPFAVEGVLTYDGVSLVLTNASTRSNFDLRGNHLVDSTTRNSVTLTSNVTTVAPQKAFVGGLRVQTDAGKVSLSVANPDGSAPISLLTLANDAVIIDPNALLAGTGFGNNNSASIRLGLLLDANHFPIMNLPTPVSPGDAVNKAYVDSAGGTVNLDVLDLSRNQWVHLYAPPFPNFNAGLTLNAGSDATLTYRVDNDRVRQITANNNGISLNADSRILVDLNPSAGTLTLTALVPNIGSNGASLVLSQAGTINMSAIAGGIHMHNSRLYVDQIVGDDMSITSDTYLDIYAGSVVIHASVTIGSRLAMGGHAIIQVLDPVNPQDAATKAYVDGAIAAVTVPPSTGTTSGRPASPTIGQLYFDQDISLPVWWSGSAWINSTGGIA